MRDFIFLLLIFISILIGAYWLASRGIVLIPWRTPAPSPLPEFMRLKIGPTALEAERVQTLETRAQGLSGRENLPEDQGMIFIFPEPGNYGFWMRQMRFPLDIIWISAEKKIIGIEPNIPPPLPSTPETELKIYYPPEAVQYVLEGNAGWSERHQIRIGDLVIFE